jgi:transposase
MESERKSYRKVYASSTRLAHSSASASISDPSSGVVKPTRITGRMMPEDGLARLRHFASYCGAAPVERGSGQNRRMQINPGGNRRLNWALHIVAMVRLRMDGGRSKEFLAKAQLRGKTKRSALRLLKTYIARELFRVLSTGQLYSLPAEMDPIG